MDQPEFQIIKALGRMLAGNDPGNTGGEISGNRLKELLEYHQLLPLLHYFRPAFDSATEIPGELFRQAEIQKMSNIARFMQYEAWLRTFQQEADIPFIVIKGILAAQTLYPDISLRTFGDLDVLVQPGDMKRMDDYLMSRGLQRYNDLYARYSADTLLKYNFARHYIDPAHPGFAVDVHLNLSSKLHPFQFPRELLWKNRVDYKVMDVQIPGLTPEFQAAYLLYHAFKHYYFKWCWFNDTFLALDRSLDNAVFLQLLEQFELKKLFRLFLGVSELYYGRLPGVAREGGFDGLSPLRVKWLSVAAVTAGRRERAQAYNRIWLSARYFENPLSSAVYLWQQFFPPMDTQTRRSRAGYLVQRLIRFFNFLWRRHDSTRF